MEKTLTAALAVAAGALPAVLGVGLEWPVWLWAAASAAAVVLVLLIPTARARPEVRPDPQRPPAPEPGVYGMPSFVPGPVPAPAPDPVAHRAPEPPVEQPLRTTSVTGIPLPSAVPDYDFLFSATVWWRQTPDPGGAVHAAPDTLAVEAVLERARAITEREQPGRSELLRHRLDGLLGTLSPDSSGTVVAMGGQVGLALPEADRARLDKLAEVRKAEEIWEYERRYERNRRAYLGEDVLRSPGSAVVWWLARNDEEVQGAVEMIGPLAQLAAAANDQAVDVLYRHLAAMEGTEGAGGVPFLDVVAPVPAGDTAEEERGAPGTAAGAAPDTGFGPAAPAGRGPSVVGPLNALMDDIELKEDGDRTVYAHRVARFTDAAGRPDAAARILRSLGEDGGGDVPGGGGVPGGDGEGPAGPSYGGAVEPPPAQRVFVVGPVRPAGESGGSGEPEATVEEAATPVTSAWEVLRGSVNGEPRGPGTVGEDGWGGADQSY
ncbi:hypothetical protein ACFCX4_01780 [Kitasatospora sp. NPDC056327]|uniref:hypothetical protein n=1 Tax=Kitasatospora sp. NPDC056327 TaxID=3345785 RepID=UPI0035E2627D